MNVTQNRLEWFKWYFAEAADEQGDIDRVLKPNKGNLTIRGINLESLASYNRYRGFYEYYVQFNVSLTKHFFDLAAQLAALSNQYPGGWDNLGSSYYLVALLSDNQETIIKYSVLASVDNNSAEPSDKGLYPAKEFDINPKKRGFNVLLLQAVLRQDWDQIELLYRVFQQKIVKPQPYQLDMFHFYFALKAGNTDKMVEIIEKNLKPKIHIFLNEDRAGEFSGELWSHYPTLFTKIAWIYNYQIEIKSDLVPMQLMPIEPLAKFELGDENYDFLKPNYVWPVHKQSWIRKYCHFFKK